MFTPESSITLTNPLVSQLIVFAERLQEVVGDKSIFSGPDTINSPLFYKLNDASPVFASIKIPSSLN